MQKTRMLTPECSPGGGGEASLEHGSYGFLLYPDKWGLAASLTCFPGGTSGQEPTCQCRRHNEMLVRSLDWEDPLEEGMATHPSVLV